MTLIYLILAFVVIILLLFFLPIRLTIEYDKSLKLNVKILFFKFSFDFSDDKYDSENYKPIKNNNHSGKSLNSVLNTIKKKGLINSLKLILGILKTSGDLSLEIFKKINVNNLTFLLKLGGKDAASVAIKYGQACFLIYSLFGYLISLKSPEVYKLKVVPDFESESTYLYSKITLTITMLNLFQSGIKYINRIKNLFYILEVKQ